jgi:bifunctional ADP-heptose synthase (sugar kinase/adenylyltransferase)
MNGKDFYEVVKKKLGNFKASFRPEGISTTVIVRRMLVLSMLNKDGHYSSIKDAEAAKERVEISFRSSMDGAFDMFHRGHVSFICFQQAKKKVRDQILQQLL